MLGISVMNIKYQVKDYGVPLQITGRKVKMLHVSFIRKLRTKIIFQMCILKYFSSAI